MSLLSPFHLAIPVINLEETIDFYQSILGCSLGRQSTRWVDFNFFGHQLSAHLKPESIEPTLCNEVDGESVPVRHFGLVLDWEDWQELSQKLQEQKIRFLIQPTIRFEGDVGEQATLFIKDPSGNALEFKSFKSGDQLFATD